MAIDGDTIIGMLPNDILRSIAATTPDNQNFGKLVTQIYNWVQATGNNTTTGYVTDAVNEWVNNGCRAPSQGQAHCLHCGTRLDEADNNLQRCSRCHILFEGIWFTDPDRRNELGLRPWKPYQPLKAHR